jgi:serine phosphatase RsbU (regulator of sigma subunit)
MTLDELLSMTMADGSSEFVEYAAIDTRKRTDERPYGEPTPVDVPKDEIAVFLRDNPVFHSMKETELDEFVSRMNAVRYKSGELICREGDPGDEMWIIREGGMRVSKRGQTVVDLPAGAPVGEMSILDGKPRSTDLIAIDNPLLFVLTREAYAEVFGVNVDAGSRLVLNIAEIQQTRLRNTTQQAIDNAVAAERAEAEIRYVKQIQDLALSKNNHPAFGKSDIAVSYKGARGVSGDYYDFVDFPTHPNQLIVIMGDAMGHGLRAGVEMLLAKCASYMQVGTEPSVEKITAAINNITCYIFDAGMFMTFVCALIDRETHTIRYTNAGQQSHPYLYRMKTGELVALRSQTLELGVTPGAKYYAEELPYDDDDLLIFYSDGIIEAPYCPAGATEVDRSQDFGDARLREFIVRNAHKTPREITDALLAEVKAFCRFYDGFETINGEEVEGDDVTTIVIRLD